MMDQQFQHAMLPQPTHEEFAGQNFVQSLKIHIFRHLIPGSLAIICVSLGYQNNHTNGRGKFFINSAVSS